MSGVVIVSGFSAAVVAIVCLFAGMFTMKYAAALSIIAAIAGSLAIGAIITGTIIHAVTA